jgi:hypothetical protein
VGATGEERRADKHRGGQDGSDEITHRECSPLRKHEIRLAEAMLAQSRDRMRRPMKDVGGRRLVRSVHEDDGVS